MNDSPNVPDSTPSSSHTPAVTHKQSWLASVIIVLLLTQLTLLWIQGRLLNRQHQEIQDLRDDIQSLSESLSPDLGEDSDDVIIPGHSYTFQTNTYLQPISLQNDNAPTQTDDDAARKELEKSSASGTQAVSKARDLQSKLSFQNNATPSPNQASTTNHTHIIKIITSIVTAVALIILVRTWLQHRS